MSDTTTEQYERAMRTLIDNRMVSGRTLAQAASTLSDARATVAQAERDFADARTTALRAGWTSDELRRVFRGLDGAAPAGASRRSRTPRPRTLETAAGAAAGATEPQPEHAQEHDT